jgi:hypothetical protein
MSKILSALMAVVIAVVLSSCSLLAPFIDEEGQLDARMEQIADAINSHDAAAIKELFSPRALEDATDIDAGLDHFLSFFPNGVDSWESDGFSSSAENAFVKWTRLVKGGYKVSADGKDYYLSLIVFTVNDNLDPENVGVYGMGVVPWSDDVFTGPMDAMGYWGAAITLDTSDPDGYPGVYVGYPNDEMSLHMMTNIVDWLNRQSDLGLKQYFSEYARTEHATSIDDELEALVALFPEDDLVWEDLDAVPVVRESSANGGETTLLVSTYQVSYAGVDYWLSFAYFTENAIDPSNIGIYAIGVAPRTESGDSPAEQALFAWADSFDVDARTPPSIFIPQ